ncbi:cytochrome P450 [Flagelloscypha sp. PMI_526]|nr:cytochrome P450 [Flagelloscypha sp. PMI_526]
MLWLLLKTIGLVYVVRRIRTVLQARSFGPDVVKIYPFLSPMHPLGFIFPDLRFFRVVGFHWKERASLYEGNALRTIVFVPLLMGEPFVFTGNIDAFYNNLALNSDWIKADNPALREFGDNVVTSIGQTWKRHRRITAPAFNQDTYQNVWDTTAWVYREMMDKNGWRGVAETSTFNINEATHKVAIFLVTIVGFNIPMNWTEPKRNADGRLSTQSMILTIAGSLMQRGLLPRWVFKLPFQKFREMEEAFSTFEEFMVARIEARETEIERLRATGSDEELGETLKDVFGRLVHARMADGKSSMSDREIIGNCFAFAFAGHETSANALAALLGLLALYPDEQEWVYKSIVDTVGDKEMTFEDYDHLDGVLACLYEGLRLFPVAWLLAQVSGQDTVLSLSIGKRERKEVCPSSRGDDVFDRHCRTSL